MSWNCWERVTTGSCASGVYIRLSRLKLFCCTTPQSCIPAIMLTRILTTSAVLALAAAAPAPQVAGYSNADASFSVVDPTGNVASSFGPDSQIAVSLRHDDLQLSSSNIHRPVQQWLFQVHREGVPTLMARPATDLSLEPPPPLAQHKGLPLLVPRLLPCHQTPPPPTTTVMACRRTPCPFPTLRLGALARTVPSLATR